MGSIAERLVSWGQFQFGTGRGWHVRFAKALGMSPQSLISYTKGHRVPGSRVQAKLRELGADVEYIMTGESAAERARGRQKIETARDKSRIYFFAPDGVSDEDKRRYEKLAELIARIPPGETERIRVMVQAYLKSVATDGD